MFLFCPLSRDVTRGAFHLQGETGPTNIFKARMMVSRKESMKNSRLRPFKHNFDVRLEF